MIIIIEDLIKYDRVQKMQWKGYEQLSYTIFSNMNRRKKISFALEPAVQDDRKISILTIINYNNQQRRMENRLAEDPKIAAMREQMEKLFNNKTE